MWLATTAHSVDLADRLRAVVGIALMLGLCWLLSENRRVIARRMVLIGLALQVVFAAVLLRFPPGRALLDAGARGVEGILHCALEGSRFLFGANLVDPAGPAGFVFAFRVLPTVIFVAALFAVLYHLGLMQPVVRCFAWLMARALGSSGAESLNAAASLFLGQTEAPLTIRPYLPRLTSSELMVVMVSGMGLVSGGVLGAYIDSGAQARDLLTAILVSLPATIYLAKMLVPETGLPETLGTVRAHDERPDDSLLDAAARGTREGLELALNIAAMLIAFLGLIALTNLTLGRLGGFIGMNGLSLQSMLGTLLAPVAWFLGVPWADAARVGTLLGERTVLNEMIAYGELGKIRGLITERSYSVATVALCGFANLSSIGIQIGGIGALLPPERRPELARLGLRALLAATLANFVSAAIVGIVL